MNVPVDNPFFQFLYWIINTPGLGSVIVWLVILGALTTYGLFLHQIRGAKNKDESPYPGPLRDR